MYHCHMARKISKRATAKVFQTGRSQAVRIPKEYRFECDEVFIEREGARIILTPRPRSCAITSKPRIASLRIIRNGSRMEPSPAARKALMPHDATTEVNIKRFPRADFKALISREHRNLEGESADAVT